MKEVVAVVIIAVCAYIGFRFGADPLFDAAATHACGGYASEHNLTLEEANGFLAWRQIRNEFDCRFRSDSGELMFIREDDGQVDKTWRYRWLRTGGWAAATGSLVLGVAISGMAGLLPADD
jgi:hypothetical protein